MHKWTSRITGKLGIVMLLLLASTVAQAVPNIKVVNSVYDNLTTVVRVPIELTNDANVTNLQFDLVYTNTAVNAVAAFAGDVFATDNHDVQSDLIASSGSTETYRVVITPMHTSATLGTGKLLVVPFMVDTTQLTSVTVDIQNVVMVNANGDQVTSTATSGIIINSTDTTTDSDGDGVPDSAEIAYGTDPNQSNGNLIPPGSTISSAITEDSILAPNATYYISGDISVGDTLLGDGANLTVYGDTTIKFNYGAGLKIEANSQLQIVGDNVIFTSNLGSPYKGSWDGIRFNSGSVLSPLTGVTIEWATWGVYFDNADGEVTYSTLTNNSYAIYVRQTSNVSILHNTITSNTYGVYLYGKRQSGQDPNVTINYNNLANNSTKNLYAYWFYDAKNAHVDAKDNWWGSTDVAQITDDIFDYLDNRSYSPKVDFITFLDGVDGSPIDGNAILGEWYGSPALQANTTYHVLDTLIIPQGQVMAVPMGVTFKFYGLDTKLQVYGTLSTPADDGSAAPTLFRSNKDNAGWSAWKGIEFMSTSSNIDIQYAEVRDANNGVYFNNADGSVQNTRFENNYYGVYVYYDSSPTITNGNEMVNNGYGVYVYGSGSGSTDPHPVVTYNTIKNNSYKDFYAYRFQNAASVELDATYNNWGTIDEAQIETNIYENSDYYLAPVVVYKPYVDDNGTVYGLPDVPTALLTGPSSGTLGELLTFDGSSSSDPQGGALQYDWDFGDGTTLLNGQSSEQHSYTAAGDYTVILTVTDVDGLTGSSQLDVSINDGSGGGVDTSFVLTNNNNPGQPFMPGDLIHILWGDASSPDPASFAPRIGLFAVGSNNGQYLATKSTTYFNFNSDVGQWDIAPWPISIPSWANPGQYELRFINPSTSEAFGDPSPPFTIGIP